MRKHRCDSRGRASVILDAGYVSIRDIHLGSTSKLVGLHGKKLICIVATVLILFLVSVVNLTCLIWIMYRFDWSPFHRSDGSKIFRFDPVQQQLELHNQVIFHEPVYAHRLTSGSHMDFTSDKQTDIYGDHNSILLDHRQIAMNTEHFYTKNQSLMDFSNLQNYKFYDGTKTRIHLELVNTQHIHHKQLTLNAKSHLTIANANRAFFYSQNMTLETNRHNRRSILCFKNPLKKKKGSYRRQKTSYGNLDLRSESIFLDLTRSPFSENKRPDEMGIFRMCICNTTFLLLRSFAHQPCPLC